MNAYIVAAVDEIYMVPVSGLYKTYKGAKKFRDYYVKEIDDKSRIIVLRADNWRKVKELEE